MAQYNEILTGALSQVLAKRLGMQTGTPAPTLAPEIMPVVSVEADRPEWKALANEGYFGAGGAVAAGGAGTFSRVLMINPASSGVIAVIEYITGQATGGVLAELETTYTSALHSAVQTVARDTRFRTGNAVVPFKSATCGVFTKADGASYGTHIIARWTGAAEYTQPIILTPGCQLLISAVSANALISPWCLAWRERPAVQGELV